MSIGNFDGVHLGHQALIAKLLKKSKELNVPAVIIIFEPQPLEFFKKGSAPDQFVPRLTRLREKIQALVSYGVDKICVIRFDKRFAEMTAQSFIEKILIKKLQTKYIIVGDDFRFGKNREGSVQDLLNAGLAYEAMESVFIENRRVSSTWVREALLQGQHDLVKRLLNRPYTMMGRVVYGDKLGRQLGFPTANIHLHRAKAPVLGIYAVKMHGISEQPLLGVANVGTRPTVGGTRSLLEVHLFNFNREIYREYVTVEFCKKFRDEVRFPNLDLLIQQIEMDVKNAKEYFKDYITESATEYERV